MALLAKGILIADNTIIQTLNGKKIATDIVVGDAVFEPDGSVCNVIDVIRAENVASFKLSFDDGCEIVADGEQKFLTWTRQNRHAINNPRKDGVKVAKTPADILATLKYIAAKPETNHSIPCCLSLQYPTQKLLVDPYVLGAWLGDGTTNSNGIESADQNVIDNINAAGYCTEICKRHPNKKSKSNQYSIGGKVLYNDRIHCQFKLDLDALNVRNNKHIPDQYLHGDYSQRLSLLQGLMDTDGCCSIGGGIEFCSVLPELANQTSELIKSFGIKSVVRRNESWLYDKRHKDRYRIGITTQLPIFRLARKLERINLNKQQMTRTTHRYIERVEQIAPTNMVGITTDSRSGQFLITENLIAAVQ